MNKPREFNLLVLFLPFLLSLGIYFWVGQATSSGILLSTKLDEYFALTALAFLYAVFVVEPLNQLLHLVPVNENFFQFKRSLIVGAVYLAFIHAYLSFFQLLGGFAGLFFLDNKYLLAISLSFTALVILSVAAVSSFEGVKSRLNYFWKRTLEIGTYLAGLFVVVHALMLGTHFQDLSGLIPQMFLTALGILLLLEANQADKFLKKRLSSWPSAGILLTGTISLVVFYALYGFIPGDTALSLGIHAQHIQLAKQAQQGFVNPQLANSPLSNLPILQGDRTRRFDVSFKHPEDIKANTDTPLSFAIYDASSGNQVLIFSRVYSQPMHLIIVDSQLNYFNHIHPEQFTSGDFKITTQFPHDGIYHLYLDFQPLGAIEQQFSFNLTVGSGGPDQTNYPVDSNLTKDFGNYSVTLSYPQPLQASKLSVGQQLMTFDIKDKNTGQPVTNLQPYLAAFGHLVMINQKSYDYLHVHPTNLVAPKPTDTSGPTVEFMPLGLYGPIKPGVYRVFAQFNPGGKLFTADYTVEVK